MYVLRTYCTPYPNIHKLKSSRNQTDTIATMTTKVKEKEMTTTLEQEKEINRLLVWNTVIQYCDCDSEFLGLSRIGKVFEEAGGDEHDLLECQIITGGVTNFAYKLFLKEDPSIALFCKIGFNYALWLVTYL